MPSKVPRKPDKRAQKPEPRREDPEGLAAAAGKNRERAARLLIIEGFRRIGIPFAQWPNFVRAFYTDPQQWIEFRQPMKPPTFQAPDYDPLNQSREEWSKGADIAWEQHRNRFLQECKHWVDAGVDQDIEEGKRSRGTGTKVPAHPEGRRRGDNTPIVRRYEWAARYLLRVPLKEIAGADADPTTVGRIVREIVRMAGWSRK